MSFLRFLISKVFLKNIAMAVGAIALLLIATFITISIYTHHGESFAVPDLRGLSEEQFSELIKEKELRYNIIDSVHIKDFMPGAVVEQLPHAGSMVKENRTIHVTINAISPEQVQVPNLINYSLRNAKVILESYGLKTGKLIYIPSEFTNEVLGQHYQGKAIDVGTSVLKGSVIDLLIGKGLSHEKTNIPDLTGQSIDEARHFLLSQSLNIGATIFDTCVITSDDSLFAFIWKQRPKPEPGSRLPLGSSIDIWLSTDSAHIRPDSILIDSLQLDVKQIEPIEEVIDEKIEEF